MLFANRGRQFIQYFSCAGMPSSSPNALLTRLAAAGRSYRPSRRSRWVRAIGDQFGQFSRFVRVQAAQKMESPWSPDDDIVYSDQAALERDGLVRPSKTFTEIFADDAVLITRLTVILLRLFGFGWKWMMGTFRLVVFVILLLPAFTIMFGRYLMAPNIRRGIRYGIHARSFLDIYLPTDTTLRPEAGWPVVVFFPGGAWIIGHRAWASIMGWEMARKGIVFVSIDYRNFPQGRIIDMLVDADNAISFVFDNIASYDGDTTNITLCGQSAGAHIAAVALVQQCKWERAEPRVAWRPSQLRRFIGIAGPYDLEAVCQHLHGRGLYKRVLRKIMGRNLVMWSPTCALNDHDHQKTPLGEFPEVILFHGDADRTVPVSSSLEFCSALKRVVVDVRLRIYKGKTHTDLILEDSMAGYDPFLQEFIAIVRNESPPEVMQRSWPMCFRWQIALARYINPF